MSFRGAKRRGNPLNRNVNTVTIANDLACSRNLYRAENLCYQFKQGQKLLPQFRKIVCLVFSVLCTQADKRILLQGVLINGMCLFGVRAATAARKRTPSLMYSTSERTSLDSFRPRTSDIKRERYQSMRVLSVSPRGADAVGSLLRGNGGWGNT